MAEEQVEVKQPSHHHCVKCNRELADNQFYTYKDGSKVEMCKKCLTMHIDPFDESTFVWLFKKMDVPDVRVEWNAIRDKDYSVHPSTANGTAVFGKYLSKMRLKQYKQYGYVDSEEANRVTHKLPENLNAQPEEIDPAFEAEMKAKLEAGEISEAQYKTLVSAETVYQDYTNILEGSANAAASTFYDESNFIKKEDLPDPSAGLTEEDKIYLATKWGRLYEPSDLVELETDYKRMTDSFDIQDTDTSNTLILICKTNLKMNQAIDQGDVEGFQKLSRVYDSLRKSAKFTAAQNKSQNNSFVSSVGELVDYCEKKGGVIPRYKIEEPYDKVDKIINDLKEYTRSLIYSDTSLASQIEEYLKQKTLLDQKKLERLENGGQDPILTNDDYADYFDQMNNNKIADKEVYNERSIAKTTS